VTAWVALTSYRRVTAGGTVLTLGSGGVSVFALQFARLLGARVIATTSTAEKTERLRALGASEVIDYTKTPNWDERVRELTNARGVDCVVEIRGPGTIAMSLKALAVGGHLSLIGASLSKSGAGLDPLLLTGRGITLGAISVGSRELDGCRHLAKYITATPHRFDVMIAAARPGKLLAQFANENIHDLELRLAHIAIDVVEQHFLRDNGTLA
jgi:NADPH:quinone reductase-like Zn-dependent oxidoreductase